MKVKQAKLAQALRGEASNILEDAKYDLDFQGGMLSVKLKVNPKNFGDFIVFPANIAWIELAKEEALQAAAPAVTEAKGKAKKA